MAANPQHSFGHKRVSRTYLVKLPTTGLGGVCKISLVRARLSGSRWAKMLFGAFPEV
jgi:hypothetical protein